MLYVDGHRYRYSVSLGCWKLLNKILCQIHQELQAFLPVSLLVIILAKVQRQHIIRLKVLRLAGLQRGARLEVPAEQQHIVRRIIRHIQQHIIRRGLFLHPIKLQRLQLQVGIQHIIRRLAQIQHCILTLIQLLVLL